jgi:hypothetical protein
MQDIYIGYIEECVCIEFVCGRIILDIRWVYSSVAVKIECVTVCVWMSLSLSEWDMIVRYWSKYLSK